MTNLFKTILFISSYSPLYLIIALSILPYENFDLKLIIQDKVLFTVCLILIVLFTISILPLMYIHFCECNDTLESKRVTQKHEEILSYLITYIVPLLAIDIEKMNTLITNAILFGIIGILYVKSNMVHINITFLLFGWNVYEDEGGRMIISKEKADYFAKLKLGNKSFRVRKLATNIYLHKS